jgi:quinol-cytochrome oxidoreductase complex cytochrome b subunit
MTHTQIDHSNVNDESIPFYPDHVRSEVRVVIGFTILVLVIGLVGLLLPVGVGEPADPLNTPAHVKPEWYFLALYQLLKFIPKTTGAVLPVLALLLITFWPFIDRKPETSRRVQRIRLILVVIALIVLAALTVWGEVS